MPAAVRRGSRNQYPKYQGHDWTERYPRIVEEARRIKMSAVIDAEVICTDEQGRADFDRLHSRCFEHEARLPAPSICCGLMAMICGGCRS